MNRASAGLKLKKLLQRPGKVLAVLGAPNAFHAKIMEANGVEACFVGTSITGGNYTGLPDLGVLSMTECVGFAKWIARSVKIPVILDGDTGHGGIMAVQSLANSEQMGHLWGDVLALFVVAAVLALLTPRGAATKPALS